MSAVVTGARPQQPARRRARAAGASKPQAGVALPCRVRLDDGRLFTGSLPAARHWSLQLGMLHAASDGLVEIAAGRRSEGKLMIDTRSPRHPRRRAAHFLPGGGTGENDWLKRLLALVERHVTRGDEVFAAAAVRSEASPEKDAVTHTRALWVDVDQPGQLHRLWAFLAERPCHLLVQSGGSGGVHAYWRLAEPLQATRLVEKTGELLEPIERAHLRIIHYLGVDDDGKPDVADLACKERSRVMRLAGTVNGKTSEHARILEADFRLPGYTVAQLVGDLPDPAPPRPVRPHGSRAGQGAGTYRDPYKRIAPPEYFEVLAGIAVPRSGRVRCPSPTHPDQHPSCDVGDDATQGWYCRSCGAGGAIYDLASVLLGGPTGQALRGEEFKRAQAYVHDAFGALS